MKDSKYNLKDERYDIYDLERDYRIKDFNKIKISYSDVGRFKSNGISETFTINKNKVNFIREKIECFNERKIILDISFLIEDNDLLKEINDICFYLIGNKDALMKEEILDGSDVSIEMEHVSGEKFEVYFFEEARCKLVKPLSDLIKKIFKRAKINLSCLKYKN